MNLLNLTIIFVQKMKKNHFFYTDPLHSLLIFFEDVFNLVYFSVADIFEIFHVPNNTLAMFVAIVVGYLNMCAGLAIFWVFG